MEIIAAWCHQHGCASACTVVLLNWDLCEEQRGLELAFTQVRHLAAQSQRCSQGLLPFTWCLLCSNRAKKSDSNDPRQLAAC